MNEINLVTELAEWLSSHGEVEIDVKTDTGGQFDLRFRNKRDNGTIYIETKEGSGEISLPLGSVSQLSNLREAIRGKDSRAELFVITSEPMASPVSEFLTASGIPHLSFKESIPELAQQILDYSADSTD
tara:strand:- start:103 stop:489 length:387 start_codon:yes stop_codon:yes gene_type:complete